MQVSSGFSAPADWSWLVLVGAVVGDFLASDDAAWLATVARAAASSPEAMSASPSETDPCSGSASSPLDLSPSGRATATTDAPFGSPTLQRCRASCAE